MTNTGNVTTFYCHNAHARASMALLHEKQSGTVLLAVAFATLKPDHRGKPEVYSKARARELLNARLTAYMLDVAIMASVPPQAVHPNVFYVGVYDGDRSKNDIFGPLIDTFHTTHERRNVDNERLFLHTTAQELVTIANHRIAKEMAKTLREVQKAKNDALIASLKNLIKSSLIMSPKHLGAVDYTKDPAPSLDYVPMCSEPIQLGTSAPTPFGTERL